MRQDHCVPALLHPSPAKVLVMSVRKYVCLARFNYFYKYFIKRVKVEATGDEVSKRSYTILKNMRMYAFALAGDCFLKMLI